MAAWSPAWQPRVPPDHDPPRVSQACTRRNQLTKQVYLGHPTNGNVKEAVDLDDTGIRAERLGIGLPMVVVPFERGREVPALDLKGDETQNGKGRGAESLLNPGSN